MPEAIQWSYAMQVAGGPLLAAGDVLPVEAYDKLRIALAAGQEQQVDLAPAGSGAIQLVVIQPATPDAKLTYEVNGEDVPLDGPQIFVGAGAVSLLGDAASSISLKNGTGAEATVDILVGRDATP
jgi:hypothetical protein